MAVRRTPWILALASALAVVAIHAPAEDRPGRYSAPIAEGSVVSGGVAYAAVKGVQKLERGVHYLWTRTGDLSVVDEQVLGEARERIVSGDRVVIAYSLSPEAERKLRLREFEEQIRHQESEQAKFRRWAAELESPRDSIGRPKERYNAYAGEGAKQYEKYLAAATRAGELAAAARIELDEFKKTAVVAARVFEREITALATDPVALLRANVHAIQSEGGRVWSITLDSASRRKWTRRLRGVGVATGVSSVAGFAASAAEFFTGWLSDW